MSEQPVMIRCRENGPYVVTGPVKLTDHLGNVFTPPASAKNNIALCRCGHSQRKPFCDGTHKQTGFQAAETAPAPVVSEPEA